MSNRSLFLTHVAQTSPAPMALAIKSASGIYITDEQDKKYLDLISGIAVSNLGHGNKNVIAAIQKQANKHMHVMVYGEFIQSPQVSLATKLCSYLPKNLQSVYFTNSGAEAVEGALKLAKRVTGRSRVVSFTNAYHGSTHGALSIGGSEFFKNAFRPLLPECYHFDYNDGQIFDFLDGQVAAVIFEYVQAEAGNLIPDPNFLFQLAARCKEKGILLIADEIQSGMGRTGSLFALEQHDFTPDILLVGKAFGGGMPLAAFISSYDYMQALASQPVLGHITTFGGHPVCCAAAEAALDDLIALKLLASVTEKGELFKFRLKHRAIKKLNAKGLMVALHFESFEINKKIIDKCLNLGMITDWFLYAPQALRIAPPLSITTNEINQACDLLLQAIDESI